MRWSLFSLIATAVLTLTAAAATTAHPARTTQLVLLTCPELVRLLRAFVLTPPVREQNTSCTGWPGAATIRQPRKPATSADTNSRTSHDRNYSCRV
ncbi:hypothetical protein ACWDWS_38065 [Streptomyces sp. NPDC003328]